MNAIEIRNLSKSFRGLYALDEPINGLDVDGMRIIREILVGTLLGGPIAGVPREMIGFGTTELIMRLLAMRAMAPAAPP